MITRDILTIILIKAHTCSLFIPFVSEVLNGILSVSLQTLCDMLLEVI